MLLSGPFQKFVEASPVTVMMRGIIENLFHPERLERLFNETAVTQYTRTLPFATVAEVMGKVVFNVNPSLGAALKDRVATLPVTKRAFYLKLNDSEPAVAAVLARDSANQLAPVIRKLGLRTPLLPGFNIRVLDGNHFAATEHRLLETRNDLWIADRNFCVLAFLFGIIRRNAWFAIRHHASMPIELIGRRTLAGKSETGRVYEQKARITDPATGRTSLIRPRGVSDDSLRDSRAEDTDSRW